MGGTGPGAVHDRPSWHRWLLAVVPWVAAAALGLAGWSARRPAPVVTAADAPAVAVAASPTPAVPGHPGPSDPSAVLPPHIELEVIAAARTALGTAGLETDGPAPDRWPLDVRIVDVRDVADGLGVATVNALVIEQTADGWAPPTLRAVAVPLVIDPSPAVAGTAWPLPAPTPTTSPPPHSPVADPDPAVVATLVDAGWTVDTVVAVDLVDGQLLSLSLHGSPPGEHHAASHTVWLLDTPGGPRLLPTHTIEDPS